MSSVTYAPEDWKVAVSGSCPRPRSSSGYGRKIPTQYTIVSPDNRTRRVYAICYSNAASFYCLSHGTMLFLQDWRFP